MNYTPGSASAAGGESNVREGAIAWMARNSVAANLLMVIFLVGGFIVSTQVKQEVFPEFSTDIIRVSVPYPGASPAEVEKGIVLSIEDGVRGLEGVKRVTSTANEGAGTVVVELLTSADRSKALQDVKNEVDRITSFPEDAERPVVSLVESRKQVVHLLIYGGEDRLGLRQLAERVRDDLVQRPGVTYVELGLAPELEISIEIPQETLRRLNLTIEEVASIVRRSALELPAGQVRTKGGQILLRTQERRDYGYEYNDIPIATTADGTVVRLGDVAQIKDGFQETDEEASFNGQPAIFVNVYRVGDETPQAVSQAVHDYIDYITPELPDGVGLTIWRDTSEIYRDRMGLLLKNAVLGLVLVLVLLGLFLDPKLAFWVTLGIPVSVLGCFLFFPFTDASINMISLFAFIVTLGIIVDDAVVAGENIYEKREKGLDALSAAVVGTREISGPITFAVLTNIVAFLPLFFVPGISGKFFRQIPSVVVAVFIVSLIESLFVLPAHLSHLGKDNAFWRALRKPGVTASRKLDYFINEIYAPAVLKFIKYRYATFAAAIASLFVATGVVLGGHLTFTFLPKIDADLITAQATLPFGVPLAESRHVQDLLREAAKRAIEKNGGESIAKGIYSQIGQGLAGFGPGPASSRLGGSHIVAVQVSLVSSEFRDISGGDFSRAWRSEVGQIVGLENLSFIASTGASEGAAIEYNLSHRSRETVEAAARELTSLLEEYEGVKDTDDGVSNGKRQLSFTIKPSARSLGITAQDLGRQVRSAFYGAEALRQQRGRNEIKVMVRLPKDERELLQTVSDLVIRTPSGGEVPFSEAAEVSEGRSYTEIKRRDGSRVVTVSADVDELVTNANKISEQLALNEIPKLKKKYPGLSFSLGGEQEAQQESLGALAVGFVVALLAIYALLAVPFKSYVQPLIVMLSIPFGIIGAIGGHFMLGYGLSIISMFGIIALSGVVVNDSLVLVVTANRMRIEEGLSAFDAICAAGVRRFRPILLTSLTTFFGLAPMIFETSVQARFLIPMAISLGFGILFSTVIILIIVPAAYLIIEDVHDAFSATEGAIETEPLSKPNDQHIRAVGQ
ncbi:MAG: efflux RND transporter permease subunit [Bdellovibrionales bacterium]|nr:efflux RND transporter permease subunit [Bdellovibrionales bacterium]